MARTDKDPDALPPPVPNRLSLPGQEKDEPSAPAGKSKRASLELKRKPSLELRHPPKLELKTLEVAPPESGEGRSLFGPKARSQPSVEIPSPSVEVGPPSSETPPAAPAQPSAAAQEPAERPDPEDLVPEYMRRDFYRGEEMSGWSSDDPALQGKGKAKGSAAKSGPAPAKAASAGKSAAAARSAAAAAPAAPPQSPTEPDPPRRRPTPERPLGKPQKIFMGLVALGALAVLAWPRPVNAPGQTGAQAPTPQATATDVPLAAIVNQGPVTPTAPDSPSATESPAPENAGQTPVSQATQVPVAETPVSAPDPAPTPPVAMATTAPPTPAPRPLLKLATTPADVSVKVYLLGPGGRSEGSGKGNVQVTGPAAGAYTLKVVAAGYKTYESKLKLETDRNLAVQLEKLPPPPPPVVSAPPPVPNYAPPVRYTRSNGGSSSHVIDSPDL